MCSLLAPERCCPFAHEQPGLVNADLVGERSLKGPLPVLLKFQKTLLGAAASVAHPSEVVCEELTDVVDSVVVESLDHAFDHRAGQVGF